MWHIAGDNRYQACFLTGGTAFALHQQDDQAGALAIQSHGLQQCRQALAYAPLLRSSLCPQ
jgi:hypothetical protein